MRVPIKFGSQEVKVVWFTPDKMTSMPSITDCLQCPVEKVEEEEKVAGFGGGGLVRISAPDNTCILVC